MRRSKLLLRTGRDEITQKVSARYKDKNKSQTLLISSPAKMYYLNNNNKQIVVACAANDTAKYKSPSDLTFMTLAFLPQSRLLPWKHLSLVQGEDSALLGEHAALLCRAQVTVSNEWFLMKHFSFHSHLPRPTCRAWQNHRHLGEEAHQHCTENSGIGRSLLPPCLWHWALSLGLFDLPHCIVTVVIKAICVWEIYTVTFTPFIGRTQGAGCQEQQSANPP